MFIMPSQKWQVAAFLFIFSFVSVNKIILSETHIENIVYKYRKTGKEMNEVKKPKKPLIYYYLIIMLALILFNSLVVPYFSQTKITDVDYGTFMTMTEKHNIGKF